MTSVQSHASFERSSARRAVAVARTRRVVFVSLATQILETAALATGIALMAAAVALTQQNRSLLTGRGVPPRRLGAMRNAIAAQAGVVDIPDLLAVVIGPGMLAVEGDVTFDDALTVPEVERALSKMETELRLHWPDVRYVYLTPVAAHRPDHEESTHG